MKKEFDILKKTYLPPRVEFEEIEIDEMEMLMISNNSTSGGGNQGGEGTNDPFTNSLDFSFEEPVSSQSSESPSDFIMDDEF